MVSCTRWPTTMRAVFAEISVGRSGEGLVAAPTSAAPAPPRMHQETARGAERPRTRATSSAKAPAEASTEPRTSSARGGAPTW